MTKKLAIVQSSYIPWKGYFDLINSVDEFILYDDMQYSKKNWRNRNKIKTHTGGIWLTIPVKTHDRFDQKIKDAEIIHTYWNRKHWKSISINYVRAKYFHKYEEEFRTLYLDSDELLLSKINFKFLKAICRILGINTKLTWSMDYHVPETGKTKRVVALCKQAGATTFISGPTAKAYTDEELLRSEGISLQYIDYLNYPEYNQLFPPFAHHVSVIDLIFNEGPNAHKYMKSFSNELNY